MYWQLDVIGIDEAQFFEDLYDFCYKAADEDRKIVIVAGLDGDYLRWVSKDFSLFLPHFVCMRVYILICDGCRRRFGSVLDVVPLADSVIKLSARCEICGKRAYFTLRKTQDTQTELIGGADVYMPVCRQHYVNGQVVVEAAKNVPEPRQFNLQPASLLF